MGWSGMIMSVAGGLLFGFWAWSEELGHLPTALVTLAAFTMLVWLWIGFIWLKAKDRPSKKKQKFDFSYGLAISHLNLGRDDDSKDAAVQLGAWLQNATDYPMKYEVTDIIVILGDRTLPNPNFISRGGVIARGRETLFLYPPFSKSVIEPRLNGVLKMVIQYGHPEGEMVREAQYELDLSIRLDDKTSIVFLIKDHTDKDI